MDQPKLKDVLANVAQLKRQSPDNLNPIDRLLIRTNSDDPDVYIGDGQEWFSVPEDLTIEANELRASEINDTIRLTAADDRHSSELNEAIRNETQHGGASVVIR